jgi:hypothetical protein
MEWVNTTLGTSLPHIKPCELEVGEIARVISGDHAGILVLRADLKLLVELGPQARVWADISKAHPLFLVERFPKGTVLSCGV